MNYVSFQLISPFFCFYSDFNDLDRKGYANKIFAY